MENTLTQDEQKFTTLKTEKISHVKKYYIETYGCQMNVADSELIETLLHGEGYEASKDPFDSDVIFVNTCSIREKAEEKIHSQLGRWHLIKKKKPEILIGVLGCMAQNLKHEILENRPYVDIVLGPDSYRRLPELLKRKLKIHDSLIDTKLSRFEVYEGLFPNRKNGVNAWISIMRGCNKFCTFCIVPFTRGRERSRSVESIIYEAEKAVKNGFREVTLLGQNVNSYKFKNHKFHHLLEKISRIPGISRIRYTSPHPEDITDELLYVMREHENITNYIHLPLQSGSNRILKRMHRSYTKEEFLLLARKIRKILPDVGISTDIIVGFPGEDDKAFQSTINVMDKVKFDSAFTFMYSPRIGTKAAEYDDQIPEDTKKLRLERIIQLQKEHSLKRNIQLLGTTQEILIEKESKMSKKQWAGRTDSNKWVIFDKRNSNLNDMVKVFIKDAKGITLQGDLINDLKAA